MSPRSRSVSSRRSFSHSPRRRHRSRHRYSRSRDRAYASSRSRSVSRQPQVPTRLINHLGRFSADSKSSSRSLSSRHRRRGGSRSRSRSCSRNYDAEKRRSTRERPTQSRCIGVFGLSVFTTQQQIRDIFSKFGPIERIQVVIDAHTGRSRGFCFIYYENIADAKAAKDACCGLEVDSRRIRVDYSITQRPHSPTPGVYMGRSLKGHRDRDNHDRRERDDYSRSHRRSASSHRRRQYGRSRSRSYSPRRFR